MNICCVSRSLWSFLMVLLLLPAGCQKQGLSSQRPEGMLSVGAAASTSAVLPELVARYAGINPGVAVQVNYSASGTLLQQVSQGAGMDLLLFADRYTVQQGRDLGVKFDSMLTVARNTLVLAVPAGVHAEPPGLSYLLSDNVRTLCIGDPAYVPLGRYSKHALQTTGLWEKVEHKLILAGNAGQARQYLGAGEVDAAILYATDAALLGKRAVVVTNLTGSDTVYVAVIVKGSGRIEKARAFGSFLVSPEAAPIFRKFGFDPVKGGSAWESL